MVNNRRTILRDNTRRNWCIIVGSTIIGSILPDLGHGLNIITPKIDWSATHNWDSIMWWLLAACLVGYITAILLMRKHSNGRV